MCKPLHLCRLLFLATITFGSVAAAQQSYIPFKSTTSPDGRYCLGWGILGKPIDPSNTDAVSKMLEENPDGVENYLIDLKTKSPIATLGSTHFAMKDWAKNRGSLIAVWRKDSRSVLIEEAARFGSALVVLIDLGDPKQIMQTGVDVVPLTSVLRRQAMAKMLKQHPKKANTIRDFSITFTSIAWLGDRKFTAKVIGEIPKSDSDFFYDQSMTFVLPEATVKVE